MLLLFLIIILFLLSYYWSYQCLEEMVDIKTSMHLVETMADNDSPNSLKKTIDITKSGQVTINGILTTTCDLNVGNNLKVIGDIIGRNKITLGNEENNGLLDVNGNIILSNNICIKGLIQSDELRGNNPFLDPGMNKKRFGLYNTRDKESIFYVTTGGNHVFYTNTDEGGFGNYKVLELNKTLSTFNCNVQINGTIKYTSTENLSQGDHTQISSNGIQFGIKKKENKPESGPISGRIVVSDASSRSALGIYGVLNNTDDTKSRIVDIYGRTILSTTDITSANYYSNQTKDSAVIISGPQNICNGGKSSNHTCTLFVTSQDFTNQNNQGDNNRNRGASIGLGGLQSWFQSSNTVFARLSGVQNNGVYGIAGDFVVEVLDYNTGNLLEAMRINPVGNVGIGTTNPQAYLHITNNGSSGGQPGIRLENTSARHLASRIDFYNYNKFQAWTLINDYDQNGTNEFRIITGSNPNVFTIAQNGNVRVHGSLKIEGQLNFDTNGKGIRWGGTNSEIYEDGQLRIKTDDYMYISCGTEINFNTPNVYFYSRVYLQHLYWTSDSRIKKNIVKSNTNEILTKINNLSIVNYDYIDSSTNRNTVYGLIAQEVKEFLPEFVSLNDGCIPSIYSYATITSNETTVTMNVTIPNDVILKEGKMLEIKIDKTQDKKKQDKEQVKIISYTNNSITVEKWRNFDEKKEVFVCGPIVDDLHSIDKPSIALMCVGGVQELSKRVVALEKNNNDLIEALQNALERIAILEKNIPRY